MDKFDQDLGRFRKTSGPGSTKLRPFLVEGFESQSFQNIWGGSGTFNANAQKLVLHNAVLVTDPQVCSADLSPTLSFVKKKQSCLAGGVGIRHHCLTAAFQMCGTTFDRPNPKHRCVTCFGFGPNLVNFGNFAIKSRTSQRICSMSAKSGRSCQCVDHNPLVQLRPVFFTELVNVPQLGQHEVRDEVEQESLSTTQQKLLWHVDLRQRLVSMINDWCKMDEQEPRPRTNDDEARFLVDQRPGTIPPR